MTVSDAGEIPREHGAPVDGRFRPTSLLNPETDVSNPFFTPSPLPFSAPDFQRVKSDDYVPAFEAGMKQQLEQIEAIASSSEKPTFDNTLTAMEKSGEILRRVNNVFFNMTSAHTNDVIQGIQKEMAPRLAAHSDNIRLNRRLFSRIRELHERKQMLQLSPEQQQLLKEQYEDFVRAGAELTDEQQTQLRAMNEELSSLTTQFQDNLLDVTRERAVIVDRVEDLDGMDPADIAAAAEAAKSRGLEGKYLLAITNTTRQPTLISLKNRDLRRRLFEVSANRAIGENKGIDNRPLVLRMAKLRADRARILGFPNHAAWQLQPQMAHNPEVAAKMLTDLIPALLQKTKEESAEILAAMVADGAGSDLQPWDWEYYAEKVRKALYDIDEAAARPYFELNQVLQDGVFFTMNRLYGITFRERTDLPVYHPDVRVFDVLEENGEPIGLFYADYLHRESKRGGAWMSSFVDQSGLLNEKPVIVNVMNIPRPAPGEPVLLSFDHVTTMFHEMGHGVHGLFSKVQYPTLSGTSVPRDFVEFPSTFKEDWAIQPEVLRNYAKHYQTRETIPAELLEKLLRARRFNQGFETLEYVAAALLDLKWHTLSSDQIPSDVEAFEEAALKSFGILNPLIPPRYRSSYFAHIWSGGYSASYYAYMWSEVLAADAFAYQLSQGGLTRSNGNAFRDAVLSRGYSRDPMQMYRSFRGKEPSVEGLLIRRGLTPAKESSR
ncbi:MAG: M3 family metallopeptidase [Planctomyces sp.]